MLSQVVELIENKNRFGITTHIKPDGDGVGSSLGLCWLLTSLGKSAEVIVRGDYGRDVDRGYGYDETFSSGELHWLHDRDRSRQQAYAVGVALSWDLGDAVFNIDQLDVSRESRLVTQLRDDVLDEINQLYFERQRVLADLDAPPPDTSPELLALRADELASGLDAWTGGWFSGQIAKSSRGPALPAQESKP